MNVLLAMSGGVDSSVAAKILLDSGYNVTGATMKLFSNDDILLKNQTKTCCSLTDVQDARNVAYKLSIDHVVFNMTDRFKDEVVNRFIDAYINGKTPNPCIDCNTYIKFRAFLDRAELLDFDKIATGHYAVSEYDKSLNRWLLKRPVDINKDQTYVLYSMTQRQLSKTLFPLGKMTKQEVRKIADECGFVNASKPDSQDICFVPDGDYAAFIENYTGSKMKQGHFIDPDGNILGTHNGIGRYTIGQRKGLNISLGKPMYVFSKSVENNTVSIGEETYLYKSRLEAGCVNLIAMETIPSKMKVMAKTRYNQSPSLATVYQTEVDKITLEFDKPQRAITSGQSVVMYDNDVVVGGGIIK